MTASITLQFYRERAAQARRDANEATLEHVRERCQRSEAAWLLLGDRLEVTEANRLRRDAEKAGKL